MARNFLKALVFVTIITLLISCADRRSRQNYTDPPQGYTSGGISTATGGYAPGSGTSGAYSSGSPQSYTPKGPDGYTKDGTTFKPLGYEEYMEEKVDNFLVILDASGSKFLPYNGQIKLKIAKDIARRLNQNTPNRPLVGALRRYGFEAGAWSVHTELIYGVSNYSRQAFANAIEIVRWAGGKSPLALAIDESSDDLQSVVGYIALVIISDGKIYEGDPIEAAQRIKARYGDRICIYTAQVGNLPFGRKVLEKIAEIGGCGYAVTSDDLVPDDHMRQWADDIFNRRRRFQPAPPPAPAPEPLPMPTGPGRCPDEDGDGVCDADDQCPGTPKGARVDERGCWIIEKVQFDLDRYNIKPEYYSIIDDVVRVMKMNPGLKMKIEGHTCIIASEQYNLKLSHKRAISVADYMMKQGIEPNRISLEGFGFHRPYASNKNRDGRVMNRRAEFVPIKSYR